MGCRDGIFLCQATPWTSKAASALTSPLPGALTATEPFSLCPHHFRRLSLCHPLMTAAKLLQHPPLRSFSPQIYLPSDTVIILIPFICLSRSKTARSTSLFSFRFTNTSAFHTVHSYHFPGLQVVWISLHPTSKQCCSPQVLFRL